MRADDRQEARAIARHWEAWVHDQSDEPVAKSVVAAAGFARAHAALAVAAALQDVAMQLARIAKALETRPPAS